MRSRVPGLCAVLAVILIGSLPVKAQLACTADMVDGVFAQYQRLVRLDPDSMTFGALLGTNDLPLWRDSIDVMSTDPYPLYGAVPVGGYNHGQVAQWTRMAAQAAQHCYRAAVPQPLCQPASQCRATDGSCHPGDP